MTIGYGTNLCGGISKSEADYLLRERLNLITAELVRRWGPFRRQPQRVQRAILDLAYVLGVTGALRFHKALQALERADYDTASKEILDSRFARQVPHRAKVIAELIR